MKNWMSKYHWVLFIVACGIYLNTISFDFALDDKIMITGNQITKRGWSGVLLHFERDAMDGFWAEQYGVQVEDYETRALVTGGRYRPITLAMHTVEYALFGESPGLAHFINALVYGLLCVVLYLFLMRFLQLKNESWFLIPFLLALLYAVHPLHVEVVANVKGRDELLSFLFAIIPLTMVLGKDFKPFSKDYWIAVLVFGAALFSKETSIPFIALIPIVYYYSGKTWQESVKVGSGFLVIGVIYLFVRSLVVESSSLDVSNELMNNPFVDATGSQKWGVIFLVFFAYLKLMVIPHPLTHDYYPFHLPFMDAEETYPELSHWASLLGILATVVLIVLAFKGLLKREKWSYGLWFFFATLILVSNAIFPVGVFMNERFMFIPSFGLLIALSGLLKKVPNTSWSAYGIFGVSLVFAILTVKRNYAWESDESLALTDVEVSVGSAKNQMAAGDAFMSLARSESNVQQKQQYLAAAFEHLKKSLEIYPGYFPPLDLLANVYFESGNYLESARFYKRCAEARPDNDKFINNIVIVANKLIIENQYQEADQVLQMALSLNQNYVPALDKAAELHGRYLNDLQKSLSYLKRAEQLSPNNESIIQKLGVAHAMLGNTALAVQYFEQVVQLNPKNALAMKNLGIAYLQLGNEEKGNQYIQKAEAMQQ